MPWICCALACNSQTSYSDCTSNLKTNTEDYVALSGNRIHQSHCGHCSSSMLGQQHPVDCRYRSKKDLCATASSAVRNLYLGLAPRLRMPTSAPLMVSQPPAMRVLRSPAQDDGILPCHSKPFNWTPADATLCLACPMNHPVKPGLQEHVAA